MRNGYDPRSKILFVAALSSLAVIVTGIGPLAVITLISVLVSYSLGANLLSVYRKIRSIMVMLAAVAVLQSVFSREGVVIIDLFNIPLMTSGGLVKGTEFLLRMLIIISSATIITTSTSRELVQALIRLKVPYEIAFTVSLGIRFLPMFSEDVKDTFTALRLRGIVFKELSFKKKISIVSSLFLPVTAGTLRRSERIALSMETRGFRAKNRRTSYIELKYTLKDIFLILSGVIIMIVFIYAQYAL